MILQLFFDKISSTSTSSVTIPTVIILTNKYFNMYLLLRPTVAMLQVGIKSEVILTNINPPPPLLCRP